ncbi:Nck-associated protein 1-like [Bienertia sinuspersici]
MADDLALKCSSLHLDDGESELIDLGTIDTSNSDGKLDLLLVGRLITKRSYNMEAFKRTKTKVWSPSSNMVIHNLNSNSYAFNFFTGEIWKRSSSIDHSPFWIRLYNLPFNCRSNDTVKVLTSGLGEVLEIEDDILRLDRFHRVRVMVDKGNEVKIKYKYEWLPYFCFACGVIGHSKKDCLSTDEEDRTKKLGWGLFLKASPRKGHSRDREEITHITSNRLQLFVTKEKNISTANKEGSSNAIVEKVEGIQEVSQQVEHNLLEGEKNPVAGTETVHASPVTLDDKRTSSMHELETLTPSFSIGVSSKDETCKKWKRIARGNSKVKEGGGLLVGYGKRDFEATNMEIDDDMLGFSNAFGVSSRGNPRGLCLYWREDRIEFSLISFSQNHICGVVSRGGEKWRFVGIYRWPELSNKHRDFNEIISHEENERGSSRDRREMENFREVINTCELRGLGYEGQWWTWERGNTVNTRVRERLDLFVASSSWCQIYPHLWVEHLLQYKSDHSPMVLRFTKQGTKKHKRGKIYKFETARLLDDSCKAIAKKAWEVASSVDMVEKLALVGNTLVQWNGEKFDDLGKQIKETEKALKMAQNRDITQEKNMEWNVELISNIFNERDQKCILSMPLSRRASCDSLMWAFSKDSFYLKIGKKADPKLKQKAVFLVCIIWSERNAKVFNRKVTLHAILVARLKRMVEEFGEHNNKIYGAAIVREPQSSNKWRAPPAGVVKLNADASLATNGWVGLGVVARGNDGSVLFTATRRVRAWWPPQIAEGRAILIAVKLVRKYGLTNVILQSDCQHLIHQHAKAATYLSDFDSVLEDILHMSRDFNTLVWSHVKRERAILLLIILLS